jgi:hypothetical protein
MENLDERIDRKEQRGWSISPTCSSTDSYEEEEGEVPKETERRRLSISSTYPTLTLELWPCPKKRSSQTTKMHRCTYPQTIHRWTHPQTMKMHRWTILRQAQTSPRTAKGHPESSPHAL